ncbi:MAG: hypothetical protein HYU81_03010 [Candidatus Brennerbacteria bacterium]|nr:hypothetical protein [Candidatus Brennerbacteria bacterium]
MARKLNEIQLMVAAANGAKHAFLKLISAGTSIVLDAVDGSETLAKATDIFTYIDSDFVNYGADEAGSATGETPASVYEMVQNATFAQMFGSLSNDLNKLCLTQSQIKNFVRKHRGWLRTDGYGTFFLFRSKGKFFVADVFVRSGGALRLRVRRLEDGSVWFAGGWLRLVVPQLA